MISSPLRRLCVGMLLVGMLAPAPVRAEGAKGGYGYHKGFFVESEDARFRLVFNGRLQARYELTAADEGMADSAFLLARARTALSGHVFDPALRFKFQMAFEKGWTELKDAEADWGVLPGALHIRAGQGKKPFSRQQICSGPELALQERAFVDGELGAGRDIGVTLHNGFDESPTFEWALGLFNGTGYRGHFVGGDEPRYESNVPDLFNPEAVARVGYNFGGIEGYSETDLEGGPFRFAVGASAQLGLDAAGRSEGYSRAEADALLKWAGWTASGAYFFATEQRGSAWSDHRLDALGFYAQLSNVIAGRWLPAIRYARLSEQASSGLERQAVTAGITALIEGHWIRWQLEGTFFLDEQAGAESSHWRARTQLQVTF